MLQPLVNFTSLPACSLFQPQFHVLSYWQHCPLHQCLVYPQQAVWCIIHTVDFKMHQQQQGITVWSIMLLLAKLNASTVVCADGVTLNFWMSMWTLRPSLALTITRCLNTSLAKIKVMLMVTILTGSALHTRACTHTHTHTHTHTYTHVRTHTHTHTHRALYKSDPQSQP